MPNGQTAGRYDKSDPMNERNLETCDDENGNCKVCGHPFSPHVVIAYDVNDLPKGGEVRCQVEGCDCRRTLDFDLSQGALKN
jgi:hypothetical protein